MSAATDGRAFLRPAGAAFIAVVGPSGAGKDTILAGARRLLADDQRFVFAKRAITRASDHHEDVFSHSEASFAAAREAGEFLLDWQANGLSYGLPAALGDVLAAGRHVIANISRAVIPDIRARFAQSLVLQISADPMVLAARLASRGREAAERQGDRLSRSARFAAALDIDRTITNNGAPETAIREFVTTVRDFADQQGRP